MAESREDINKHLLENIKSGLETPITGDALNEALQKITTSYYNINSDPRPTDLVDQTNAQDINGAKTFLMAILAQGGIDATTNVPELDIGVQNAQTINIGGDSSTVNINGDTPNIAKINAFHSLVVASGTVTIDTTGFPLYNGKLVLTENATLTFTGVNSGDYGTIIIDQDATGGRTLSLPANSKVINGSFDIATAANARTILTYLYDGTDFNWNYGGNYASL